MDEDELENVMPGNDTADVQTTTNETSESQMTGSNAGEGVGDKDTTPATGDGDKGSEPEIPEPKVEALSRSLRAVSSERNALKRERDELRSRLESQEPPRQQSEYTGTEDAGKAIHPDLAGLKYDRETNRVVIDGQLETPRAALAIVRSEKHHEAGEQARQNAEIERQQEQVRGLVTDIARDTSDYADNVLSKHFDDTPDGKDAKGFYVEMMLKITGDLLVKEGFDGSPDNIPDNLAELAGKCQKEAATKTLAAIAATQARQSKANAEANETKPTPGGGAPGTKLDENHWDKTPEEQDKANVTLWDKIIGRKK